MEQKVDGIIFRTDLEDISDKERAYYFDYVKIWNNGLSNVLAISVMSSKDDQVKVTYETDTEKEFEHIARIIE